MARFEPEVPFELERIATKALRKDRALRYQVAHDLLFDLRQGRPRSAVSVPRWTRIVSPSGGSRAAAAITAAAATPIHRPSRRILVRVLPPDDHRALMNPVSPIPLTRDSTDLRKPRRSSRTAATDW